MEGVTMETVTLPSDLINKIGQYLADRPFREVAGMLLQLDAAMKNQPKPTTPEHGEG